MTVQTTRGPIKTEDMGITTSHEHIFIDLTAFFQEHPVHNCEKPSIEPVAIHRLGLLDRDPYALKDNLLLDDFETQKKEMLAFKAAGGQTVVDATMDGIGRDVRALQRMSEETGLHVIVGTGYYVGTTHPEDISSQSEMQIAKHFLYELEKGIQGTEIRAGFIGEIGISELFSEGEKKVLRAAGIAQKESNVGLQVHINPWTTTGLQAAEMLLKIGVSPEKITICHVDVQNNRPYIDELLSMGVYIEFDNFGKEYYVDAQARRAGYGCFVKDTQRVELLADLIGKGQARQILLSCDVCLKTLLHAYGGWGYDHVLTNIVPMMLEVGITRQQIDMMLIDNPARFYSSEF